MSLKHVVLLSWELDILVYKIRKAIVIILCFTNRLQAKANGAILSWTWGSLTSSRGLTGFNHCYPAHSHGTWITIAPWRGEDGQKADEQTSVQESMRTKPVTCNKIKSGDSDCSTMTWKCAKCYKKESLMINYLIIPSNIRTTIRSCDFHSVQKRWPWAISKH